MRIVKAIALFVLIVGSAWFVEIARFSWDDWASLLVQRTHQPLELKLTNDTPQRIPVLDLGIAGWVCQKCCFDPGEQFTCRPAFGQASNVFIQLGLTPDEAFPNIIKAPHEQVPVWVTWRSYGAVELSLTDAGVAVERRPEEFSFF